MKLCCIIFPNKFFPLSVFLFDELHWDCRAGKLFTFQVAEVFLTAGHAFQKLGDLTLQLYSTPTDSDER